MEAASLDRSAVDARAQCTTVHPALSTPRRTPVAGSSGGPSAATLEAIFQAGRAEGYQEGFAAGVREGVQAARKLLYETAAAGGDAPDG